MTEIIDKVLKDYPQYVTRYSEGDESALEFLCGAVYSKCKHWEDITKLKELVKKRLTLS